MLTFGESLIVDGFRATAQFVSLGGEVGCEGVVLAHFGGRRDDRTVWFDKRAISAGNLSFSGSGLFYCSGSLKTLEHSY
ncbi:hypothetical protein AEAC466_21055 [Asticcacaulis sp. AC466]|nr:hypothetical protein AEAC466_21055 [Asticcacaulis sp. AC466]